MGLGVPLLALVCKDLCDLTWFFHKMTPSLKRRISLQVYIFTASNSKKNHMLKYSSNQHLSTTMLELWQSRSSVLYCYYSPRWKFSALWLSKNSTAVFKYSIKRPAFKSLQKFDKCINIKLKNSLYRKAHFNYWCIPAFITLMFHISYNFYFFTYCGLNL